MRPRNSPSPIKLKDNLTVIEFSHSRIKLIQSRIDKRGIGFISGLAVKDGIADSEDDFVNELEKIIKDNRLKIGNLIVSLDRSLVTIRSIKLPCANKEEIRNMAEWQAAKLLPYKIEEIVVSHQTVKIDDDGFSHVILVIVPRNIIKKFIYICDTLKLRPQAITLSSEGLLHWYMNIRPLQLDDTLLLVDLESDNSELVIVSQGKFIFSRSFSLKQMQAEGQANKKIIEESKLSIDYYRKQETFQPLSRIILTGDKTRALELSALFESQFGIPVEVIGHLQNLKDSAVSPDKQICSFASVGGLALSQVAPEVDLCPQDTKDKMQYLEKRKSLIKTTALALWAILVFSGILGFNLNYKRAVINALDEEIEKIGPAAQETQDIKNKISVINSQLNNKNSCIEILREIHQVAPEQIHLNTFLFEESSEVVIKGTAPTMSLVFSFVPVLNKSEFFENVQVRYATQRKTTTGELTDFEITCKLASQTRAIWN